MITPLDIARRFIGMKETSRNSAPQLAAMWKDTSYPDGMKNREPWCAAFVCHCLHQAAREGWKPAADSLPQEASVRGFLKWCRGRKGVTIADPKAPGLLPGDIIIFLPRLSHIGILESYHGQTLATIEGNTNSSGGREGDGCYRKLRSRGYPGFIARFLPA